MRLISTLLLSLMALTMAAMAAMANAGEKANPRSNQVCMDCHASEASHWLRSDHAKAMAVADNTSVLGDFDNHSVSHHGQKALFFVNEGVFQVTISYDEIATTYPVQYTFGHYPLQQYLVETEAGRLQILPFAWDSRDTNEGGQRWYHNYSHEEIRPEDRLHWRQPLQNWNGMCADCHSDGLQRHYDPQNNKFDSQWDNINVGCLSCHGDQSAHVTAQQQRTDKPAKSVTSSATSESPLLPAGQWLRELGQKTARWQGPKQDPARMDKCFACHSLRSPLTDGFSPDKALLDQFMPQMLTPPLYHADGQIKDEVYVYGSFLQSKMFAAGVGCLNCHDQHSMKLKIEGNGLCLQCHAPDSYDVASHHRHQANSDGAQCVNCHMPENRYMGVDDRRDHSFKIPRPDLSTQLDSPNACIKCHQQQTNEWAAETLKTWHGEPKKNSATRHDYWTLQSGQGIGLARHQAIIDDEELDTITRATALQVLNYSTQSLDPQWLLPYLGHREELLRLAAANTALLLPMAERITALTPLLSDPRKAIRVAAARNLLDVKLPPQQLSLFKRAFDEMQLANEQTSWRGEGRLNQGQVSMVQGQWQAAEQSLLAAVKIDPYFDAAYINLADLYRNINKQDQATSVFSRGLSRLPTSATLHYAYALHLIRQQHRSKAGQHFKQAVELAPQVASYAYAYILSVDGEGKTKEALMLLKNIIVNYPGDQQLKELGQSLAYKARDRQSYDFFSKL